MIAKRFPTPDPEKTLKSLKMAKVTFKSHVQRLHSDSVPCLTSTNYPSMIVCVCVDPDLILPKRKTVIHHSPRQKK